MLFGSLYGIYRILIVGILAYFSLVAVLRLSGKRTLSKLNAYDLVVTVSIGAILAQILLNKKVPLIEGVAAIVLLIVLQFIGTWISSRSEMFSSLLKSSPALLYYSDQFHEGVLRKERVTKSEVLQVVRKSGYVSLKEVKMVILESDGSFSVIGHTAEEDPDSLKHVIGYGEEKMD
ncbi:DUF421 domain-containing protein [Lysinibacillus sphaericus]